MNQQTMPERNPPSWAHIRQHILVFVFMFMARENNGNPPAVNINDDFSFIAYDIPLHIERNLKPSMHALVLSPCRSNIDRRAEL